MTRAPRVDLVAGGEAVGQPHQVGVEQRLELLAGGQRVVAEVGADRAGAEHRPVDRDHVVALAAGQVRRGRVAVLRHLDECVGRGEHLGTASPQVVGDVGDRGAGQGRPAAAPLDPVHPVAQLVAGQPGRRREVRAGEPAERVRDEQPAARGVLDPLLGERDAVDVLLDRAQPRSAQAGGLGDDAG